ncbi:hypothetical protein ACIQXW_08400 [Lysinibacillus sp. NPDC097162]|uniref:hypothetical protein n=1 Tax=Lysinibacillus sp. NPDC097162 TaxID=3364140 RepID=UPI003823DB7A
MSSLDTRVRKSHRKLDGQTADKDGYYHYGKWKSKLQDYGMLYQWVFSVDAIRFT